MRLNGSAMGSWGWSDGAAAAPAGGAGGATGERISPDVARALAATRATIAATCRDLGRDPAGVTLVAVSKVHGPERIRPALAAGQRVFGENRVQEAIAKWTILRAEAADPIELHLIGPLQTNKVREAVAHFDVIETLDRPRLAEALAREMDRQGRRLPVLIQVNTGEEPQKAGLPPREVEAFIAACQTTYGLDVRGVMAIPPADDLPAPHFALLREIARRAGLSTLSMGMSGDFATALAFGATHVRLGTQIFGSRPVGKAGGPAAG